MDKKALLSHLVAIYEEIEKTINDCYTIYEDNSMLGVYLRAETIRSYEEMNAQEITNAYNETEKVIKKATEFLSDISHFSAFPSVKLLISNKEEVEPIAFINTSVDSLCNDLSENLNALNNLRVKIGKIIEKIEFLPAFAPEQIVSVQYYPEKHKLTINKKSILVGDGARYDLLLRAFFNETEYSLLNGEVCDGDIYLLAENDGLLAGKTRLEKRKYLLDGYRLLNDKVRKIVPDGKDLVYRVENGFVLNPELNP